MARARNTPNRTVEMCLAPAATPVKPSAPAMSEMMRKMTAHFSMLRSATVRGPLVRLDRAGDDAREGRLVPGQRTRDRSTDFAAAHAADVEAGFYAPGVMPAPSASWLTSVSPMRS